MAATGSKGFLLHLRKSTIIAKSYPSKESANCQTQHWHDGNRKQFPSAITMVCNLRKFFQELWAKLLPNKETFENITGFEKDISCNENPQNNQ